MSKRRNKGKRTHKKKRSKHGQDNKQRGHKACKDGNHNQSPFALKNFNIKDNYMTRINVILNAYQEFIDNDGKHDQCNDIQQLICTHYPASKINFFMADYNKYVNNIDYNRVYKRNSGKCDLAQCSYIQREYRNRDIYDSDSKSRSKLYHHCQSEQSITFCQFLDALHVVKYHLIDLGLRYVTTQNEKMGNLGVINTDLTKRREIFNQIRSDLNKQNTFQSKFVTEIFAKDEEEKKRDNEQDTCTKIHHYSFGYKFYYHIYYKNNTQSSAAIPGTGGGMFDNGYTFMNPYYTFSDWYITPKYKSIKFEILNNKIQTLGLIQFENTLTKAVIKYNAFKKNIDGAVCYWKIVYGIADRSIITVSHIFSVLAYTNHTQLSAEFSKTFRKLSDTETDDSLKKRHAEYAIWGRLLRETIECWGTSLQVAKSAKYFYHGLSSKMIFDGFNQRFYAPTSTTLQKTVATTFASQCNDSEGIVVKIRNDGMANWFWNCVSWSDYPAEMEMLFIGGWQELEICGLTAIGASTDYDMWIESMHIFQKGLIQGYATNTIQPSKQHEKRIGLLMKDFLSDDIKDNNVDTRNEDVPLYVHRLFNQLLAKTFSIEIDIGVFNSEVCYVDEIGDVFYGYQLLWQLYFTTDNKIKWNVLNMLYPSVNTIFIRSSAKTTNGRKYTKSIQITNDLLKEILYYLSLSNNTWKAIKINIHYPSNSMESLQALITEHQLAYAMRNFEIGIKTVNHHLLGSCDSFFVHPVKVQKKGTGMAGL